MRSFPIPVSTARYGVHLSMVEELASEQVDELASEPVDELASEPVDELASEPV